MPASCEHGVCSSTSFLARSANAFMAASSDVLARTSSSVSCLMRLTSVCAFGSSLCFGPTACEYCYPKLWRVCSRLRRYRVAIQLQSAGSDGMFQLRRVRNSTFFTCC